MAPPADAEVQDSRPLILITEPTTTTTQIVERTSPPQVNDNDQDREQLVSSMSTGNNQSDRRACNQTDEPEETQEEDQFEVIDGISYRIVAAVTRKPPPPPTQLPGDRKSRRQSVSQKPAAAGESRLGAMRRKSSALVANLGSFLVPSSKSSHELGGGEQNSENRKPARRMSILEMTKSPPPETSIEMYLNERRRSSTVSAKFVAQQLEQQSTFETNYCARQQYFKDLNAKLINQDKKLLNVVANRGRIHRHSVDIAQLPLTMALANAAAARKIKAAAAAAEVTQEEQEEHRDRDDDLPLEEDQQQQQQQRNDYATAQSHSIGSPDKVAGASRQLVANQTINQVPANGMPPATNEEKLSVAKAKQQQQQQQQQQLASICEDKALNASSDHQAAPPKSSSRKSVRSQIVRKKFTQFDEATLSSAPAPDVKIGQRIAYKEYYGNEFGTIRWIGRVPQISADWTVGVEFDNAIGEGDGSLHGRRYFIAKDCFAKFLALDSVALVDQHVGRPEPGTMISVMSAAVRPGQMISIQRVSTVHVQHCFLNAPHRPAAPGAEFLAVNTRLHCQCPNCGPCAHVVKPPRTQRLRSHKNATHMCQFSTYTCCGMESSEEALCTYTGNKISSTPPPTGRLSSFGLPPILPGNSWMDGSGYLSNLQAEQHKLMPEEYRLGVAAPEDLGRRAKHSADSSGRRRHKHHAHHENNTTATTPTPPIYTNLTSSASQQQQLHPPGSSDKQPEAEVKLVDISPEHKAPKYSRYYRDSIENRYLFPTDDDDDDDHDVIESTLEADLENLSQARYGYLTGSNHKSSLHNDSSSRVPASARLNVFKSLSKALVSCLTSAKSNQQLATGSDYLHGSGHSENTMRLYEPAPSNLKSMEMLQATTTGHSDQEDEHDEQMEFQKQHCATNASSNYEIAPLGKIPPPADCYQHCHPFAAHAHARRTTTTTVRHQISSSSDCGFSSANSHENDSINLPSYELSCTSPAAQVVQQQQDNLVYEEQRRMNAIYRRIAARLISQSTAGTISPDDLVRLKRSLFDSPPCCLVHDSTNSYNATPPGECTEQTLADLIQKSLLAGGEQQPVTGSAPSTDQKGQTTGERVTSGERVVTSGGASSALPKAFELKLTLSINSEADKRADELASLSCSSSSTSSSSSSSTSSSASSSSSSSDQLSKGQGVVSASSGGATPRLVNISVISAPELGTPIDSAT